MIEEKRQNLGNDLISLLIKAEQEGDKLSPDELVPFCNLLLMAGNETTTNLISNAVYSILETPGAYDELARHPELIPQAVEEAVRFRAPAPMIVRFVKQDTEIRGVSLKKEKVSSLSLLLPTVMKRNLRGRTNLIFTAIRTRISDLATASISA